MNQQKIGLFLRKLRSEKAITQAELAERLGVSNRSVSRWENGTTMPDFDLLVELASYYEVDVGEILMGERKESGTGTQELVTNIRPTTMWKKSFFPRKCAPCFSSP